MAIDIQTLTKSVSNLSSKIEEWDKKSQGIDKTLSKNIKATESLNKSLNNLKAPFKEIKNLVDQQTQSLISYNKTLLEGSRNLEILGTSLKTYTETLEQLNKTTRLSQQDTASLVDQFQKGIIGPKNLDEIEFFIHEMNKMGLDAQETSKSIQSFTNIQNKLGDSLERIKKGGKLSHAEIMLLTPQDAEAYLQFQKHLDGGLESSESSMMSFQKSMQSMRKSVEDMSLSIEKAVGPVMDKLAKGFQFVSPIVQGIADVIGKVLSNSIVASVAAIGLFATTIAGSIGVITKLYSAIKKLPIATQKASHGHKDLSASIQTDIKVEQAKIVVAKKHAAALNQVAAAARNATAAEKGMSGSGGGYAGGHIPDAIDIDGGGDTPIILDGGGDTPEGKDKKGKGKRGRRRSMRGRARLFRSKGRAVSANVASKASRLTGGVATTGRKAFSKAGSGISKTGKFIKGNPMTTLAGAVLVDYGLGKVIDATHDENKSAGEQSKLNKGLQIGSSAASGALAGAAIGSIIPGVGTGIGAAVGGGYGAATGAYDQWKIKKEEAGEDAGVGALLKDSSKLMLKYNPHALMTKFTMSVAQKAAEKRIKPKEEDITALKALEEGKDGEKGSLEKINDLKKSKEDQLKGAKDLTSVQQITNQHLQQEKNLYEELAEKAKKAKDKEKVKEYNEKLKETNEALKANEEVYTNIMKEIQQLNVEQEKNAALYGVAAAEAGKMSDIYSSFYVDGEKAAEWSKKQLDNLKQELPTLEKKLEQTKLIVNEEERKVRIAEEALKQAEKDNDEEATNKAKQELADITELRDRNLTELAKRESEVLQQTQKAHQAEIDIIDKKAAAEKRVAQSRLASAEAAEKLAQESMVGIGYSAEAAKQTYDQSIALAKISSERAKEYQIQVKSAELAVKAAKTTEEREKAESKLGMLQLKANEAQAEALNDQTTAMSKLNKLREGYLDSMDQISFGIGEMSFIATQDAGLATMSAGATRFGGRGEGRMSPASAMSATGAIRNFSSDSGGGSTITGFKRQDEMLFGKAGSTKERMDHMLSNSTAQLSTAIANQVVSQQQTRVYQAGTQPTVNVNISSNPNGLSIDSFDQSNTVRVTTN